MKLPTCSGYKTWTDYGYEYNCDAHKNVESCEYCLACYHKYGGLLNPETGRKVPKLIALFLYGKVNYNIMTTTTDPFEAQLEEQNECGNR